MLTVKKRKTFRPSLGVVLFGVILLAVRIAESAYNDKYPLTTPYKTRNMQTFRIGIIADLDTKSKSSSEKSTWYSYLKKGYLRYIPTRDTVVVDWDQTEPLQLTSHFAIRDRGMELSELVVFNGKLYTFDDRTGVVYEIANDEPIPWVLLVDGNGRATKGFKSEWATVKNKLIYVGSMGREWTSSEWDFSNITYTNPEYIKTITPEGVITHINWKEEYSRLRDAMNIHWPGYVTHESAVWSEVHQKWFFLPRRCNRDEYSYTADAHSGCSVLLSADVNINEVQAVQIPNTNDTRGFSSFKFIPTSGDTVIVALRSVEVGDTTSTYITAFTINGKILLQDSFVSDLKFEGIEFI